MSNIFRLILGDQLNSLHSWYTHVRPEIIYIMMEIEPETSYVVHHIQKVTGFFAAMRQFSDMLQKKGHEVHYIRYDDPANKHSFEENIIHLIESHSVSLFEYQEPDEYRLDAQFKKFCRKLSIPSQMYTSEHFYTGRYELRDFFSDNKKPIMENFYRNMRQKHQVLMDNEKPVGNKWNFDKSNRKRLDKNISIPEPLKFKHDVTEIHQMILKAGIQTIGAIDPVNFPWPLNRKEALGMLDDFLKKYLSRFGTFQDAMDTNYPFVFHSRISFALNTKMISPREVVELAVKHWSQKSDEISIAQIEGFVRQILGWREYMRGIYWRNMPEFAKMNYFEHSQKLPEFYWTAKTKMNCMSHAIRQSLELSYAHHIQRLMLTGNFGLLTGVHPDEMDKWYLGIYIDALEWVEITNTRGMSQFADGGIVGTKPYVSSANYINKMSNYCKDCHYDMKKRYGDKACPFNSLYWRFYIKHEHLLRDNIRAAMVYNLIKKMDPEERLKIKKQADKYLDEIDIL